MAALPFNNNTTCDLFRNQGGPSGSPDVAGVKIYLQSDYAGSHSAAVSAGNSGRWTHVALMALSTDVRDGYSVSILGNDDWSMSANADNAFVPNKNGTPFRVIFVERVGYGTGQDLKRVYLQRALPAWPTQNL